MILSLKEQRATYDPHQHKGAEAKEHKDVEHIACLLYLPGCFDREGDKQDQLNEEDDVKE